MIRKVELYKSVKDYLLDSVHVDDLSELKKRDGNSLWVLSVCPFCGEEQCLEFEWSDNWWKYVFLVVDESTNKAQWVYLNYVLDCVNDYFKNHYVCLSCNRSLSFKPGYIYAKDPSYFLRFNKTREEVIDNAHIPNKYKLNEVINHSGDFSDIICFDGYENANLFEKYSENEGDSLYNNSLSRKFLNEIDEESPIGKASKLLEYYRQVDDIYEDDVKSLIQSETDRLDDSVEVEPIRKELSLDQINEVLKEMIGFETLIISLHSRLKRLYLVKERENSKYLNISTRKEEDVIKNLEKRIQEFTAERERLSSADLDTEEFVRRISESKPKLNYPTEPNKPVEPQYEKPGLFNKKKVEADNAAKKQQYDAALARYNAALSEYNRLVIEVQKMEKERQEEIRQEAMLLAQENRKKELDSIDSQIKESETKIETAKIEISKKEKEIQAAKDGLSELPWNKEFDQAVELLKKTLETKTIYEKSEIIFPKYQNLVCYSQFYEYFQAGRCTSLTGPDGAYNLYENELRQNIIIGKLDDISNSLEEIKQNQYMIYSELKSINSNISKLDDSMNKILGKVTEIGTNVEAIRNSTEIMEENTKIAAYYSKKNAELTNAMGYLVALK